MGGQISCVCVCVCVPSIGEEWLVRKVGAYLPGAHEEVLDIVNAFILTDKVGPPPAVDPGVTRLPR